MKLRSILILLVAAFSTNIFAQTNSSGIRLIKKTIIGGEGGWDYVTVSELERRVYLSHNNQVEVINADTHEKIGTIINLKGVHGICAVPAINKGYITNGKGNNVTVFNLKTLEAISEIPAGTNPDALMYDKYSNRVFIFNNDSKNISVIDVTTDKVIRTLDLGGNPEAGVANDKGLVYVNLEDANEIVAFESKTLAIKSRFGLAPGEQPTGIALDKKTNRLFSACRKSQLFIILDASNGKILAQLPIGKGVDGAAFDPELKHAVSSNGEGTFTVVKEFAPDKFEVVETIQTEKGARTIAFDTKTKHFFTVTAQFGDTPPATTENPRPRPAILPGSFMLLEYGQNK